MNRPRQLAHYLELKLSKKRSRSRPGAQTVLAIKQNEANVIEQSRGSDGVVREINRAHFTF